jgi:hypothetical protein
MAAVLLLILLLLLCWWLMCCCCVAVAVVVSCARAADSMFDGHLILYLSCSMRDRCATVLMFGVACPVVRHTVLSDDDMFAG